MLDIGWSELLLIGIVALIVVGPKDLPRMFRTLGQFTGRARNMAREFQRALDSAADETGVKTMARDLKSSIREEDIGLDEIRDIAKGPKSWAKGRVRSALDTASDPDGIQPDVTGDTADAMVEASRPQPPRPASGAGGKTPATPPADAPPAEGPRADAGGSYIPAAARKPDPKRRAAAPGDAGAVTGAATGTVTAAEPAAPPAPPAKARAPKRKTGAKRGSAAGKAGDAET